MELNGRLAEIYKEEGAWGVILRTIKKTLKAVFETNAALWFERDLARELPRLAAGIPASAELFSPNRTISWIKENGKPWMLSRKELKTALSQNHLLPHIKHNDKIIGYAKVGLNKAHIQDFQKTIAFERDFAFIYDTYIMPEYRGRNMAPFLISEVMAYLKKRGISRVGCHIPGWNTASISSYAKLGFKKIGYIRYFRILWLKVFTTDPQKVYKPRPA